MNKLKSIFAHIKAPHLLTAIDKRLRFVVSTLVLTLIMLFATFSGFDNAWIFIPILFIVSYVAAYVSILEGIEGIEWGTLFIMPVVLTIAFYVFYFLFPVRWLTRLPFIVIYAVSIYAALLTSNILNVGVERSLQLYRAAFSVNYFYQTVVVFLALNILFSIRSNFLVNFAGVFLVIFPMSLQLLWSIRLKLELDRDILMLSLFLSYVLSQIALVFSFMAFEANILALVMTACYYSFVGIIYSYVDERLFRETVRGYLSILAFVFLIALLTLSW